MHLLKIDVFLCLFQVNICYKQNIVIFSKPPFCEPHASVIQQCFPRGSKQKQQYYLELTICLTEKPKVHFRSTTLGKAPNIPSCYVKKLLKDLLTSH